MDYKPDYDYVRCNCGGIIGAWDREHYTCERCARPFDLYALHYDRLMINDKTGWIFPVVDRKGEKLDDETN